MMQKTNNEWLVTALKCAGIIILGLFLYMGIDYYAKNALEEMSRQTLKREKELLAVELESFKNTTDTIAAILFGRDAASSLVSLYSGEENNVTVRKKLLKHFGPIYERLHRHGLKHINFYLPDGTVLLRLHAPEKYGDSLLAKRTSIAMIVQEHKPLHGFESGLYRGLYPIFHKKDFVGIAELSFAFAPMKRILEKVHGGKTHYFLVFEKRGIEAGGNGERLREYRKCHIDDAFVMRSTEVEGARILRDAGFTASLKPYREFSVSLLSKTGGRIIVSFLPLKTIEGSHGGYHIILQEGGDAAESLRSNLQVARMAVILTVSVAVLLILMLQLYRIRARRAIIDPLTGIYNKQGCMVALGHIGRRYGLILIDIDNLEGINTSYGRKKGDEVLKTIAHIIDSHIRQDDLFCRYEGDEFLLFIANATEEQARIIADKARRYIAIHTFDGIGKVTVGIGIAIRHHNESLATLISRARKEIETRRVADEDENGQKA
ncbi:sensor domain-containing diguanylate cyclase [Hydrogenimonas urashimensis]|uniref:sensor domain-containing diguanylate cyclase n=1 Tax=Hydrogenimonas urashimensis TaxID=2740515 RepID=UPI001916859E|nr:diguanylate cyclase [Hydrogenimonas urashimensis]